MRLSVVIPCRNAAATLGAQLAALAAQRWADGWEVVVADNGSTDASRQVAEGFRDRLPALTVVDAGARRGAAHARNAGARQAGGEALLFCDADDQVAPGWLDAMGRALAEHPFVACRYDTTLLNPAKIRAARPSPQHDGLMTYTYPPFLPHAGGGSLGIHRAVFDRLGGFDEAMTQLEDTDLCWRAQLAGVPLAFVPDALVHVRYPESSSGLFHQARGLGRYNVLIYRRYRDRGMPRLGWLPGLARWAKLLLDARKLVSGSGRRQWIWALGWRLGRLEGCWVYRVAAL